MSHGFNADKQTHPTRLLARCQPMVTVAHRLPGDDQVQASLRDRAEPIMVVLYAMRIFLAGASGVIGARLIPLLVTEGHRVVGMTRSPEKAAARRDLGAHPVVCDVYAADELVAAVAGAHPDIVMHQLTDLPDHVEQIPAHAARNNRIRPEGTSNLLAAAQAGPTPASTSTKLPEKR